MSRKDSKNRVLKSGESQRKDGRYQYRYTDFTGKRNTIYAKTLDELRKQEATLLQTNRRGELLIPRKTVDEYYIMLKTLKKNRLRPQSERVYDGDYKNHIKPYFGKKDVSAITYIDIVGYLASLYDKGYKENTVVKIKALFKSILVLAQDNGSNIGNNVFRAFRTSRERSIYESNSTYNYLSENQVLDFSHFLQEKTRIAHRDIFLTLLYTGMRISELCGLKWIDCDFESSTIHIQRNLQYIIDKDGKNILADCPLKTISSNRIIPMLPIVKECLCSRKKEQERTIQSEYVFTTRNGFPRHRGQVSEILSHTLNTYNKKEIGVPIEHCTCHTFRHTFATLLLEKGVPIEVIQQLLGHSSYNTTISVYAKVTQKKLHIEIAKLNELYSDTIFDTKF